MCFICLPIQNLSFGLLLLVLVSFYSRNKTSLFLVIIIIMIPFFLFSFSFSSSWQLFSCVLKPIFTQSQMNVFPASNHKWMLHSHAQEKKKGKNKMKKEIHRLEEFIIQIHCHDVALLVVKQLSTLSK